MCNLAWALIRSAGLPRIARGTEVLDPSNREDKGVRVSNVGGIGLVMDDFMVLVKWMECIYLYIYLYI